MAISSGFSTQSVENILSKVTEEAILAYYFGVMAVPTRINAPYRKDTKPSVGIYRSKNNGRIQFRDFATGEAGGIIDLLQKTLNLDFKHTLERISKDATRMKSRAETRNSIVANGSSHTSSTSDIQVKTREWKKHDLDYWDSYGISLPWLKFGDIYPVSRIFFCKEDGSVRSCPADKYAYCYVERKGGKVTLKVYQPYSSTNKWINKHDSSVWDLWTKIPGTGENLIITSSRKDALCIWENTGIPAVSLQGEGYIPKEHVIAQLKNRFNNIFVLYDNDYASSENHGRIDGKKLCDKFGLLQIEIPEKYKSKDTSDLAKNHGRAKVKEVILCLINEKLQQYNLTQPF